MAEEDKEGASRTKTSIDGTTGPLTYEYLLNCEEDGQSSFGNHVTSILEANDLRDQIKIVAACMKNSSPEMAYEKLDPEGLSLSTNASEVHRPNQNCTLPNQMAGGGKVEDPSLSEQRDFFMDPLGSMKATLAVPAVAVKRKRDNKRNRDPVVAVKRKRDNKRKRDPVSS
jgi:hypothetical protein